MAKERFWNRPLVEPSKYPTPGELHASMIEYFDWAHDNPLEEVRPFSFQGDSWNHAMDKARAFTEQGLRVFLGLSKKDWTALREDEAYEHVFGWADEVMYQQKFELGAADLLNASFIARDIGLTDKRELGGIPGQPLEVSARDQLLDELARIASAADEDAGDGEAGEAERE